VAILYDEATGQTATVGATSKALAIQLFDSSGKAIVRDGASKPYPQVYAYTVSFFPAAVASTIGVLFVNRGADRRVRIRRINLSGNQVSGASAAQASMQLDRCKLADLNVLTAAGAVLPVAASVEPVPKTSPTTPSVVSILAASAGITTATRFDTATIAQFALPQRAGSRGDLDLDFDDDGWDSAFTLDYLEGIIMTSSGTAISNVWVMTFDWDEQPISGTPV
jgi:hypothetical protein